MIGSRIRPEEIVTIAVLDEKGTPKREIARTLGVTEGAVRYHLRRREARAVDGRKSKSFKATSLKPEIDAWFSAHATGEGRRPANVEDLFAHLVEWHHYGGSYSSILRFVRAHYGRPKIRTYRRVETAPGAQSQTDWGEYPRVDVGEGREYPRQTAQRILIDPTCYEGEATDRVLPPPPLGRMGKRLAKILETPVEKRPLDIYASLTEVAR